MNIRNRPRFDWFRMLVDLKLAGKALREIAERTDIPFSTIEGYKMGSMPRHDDGEALIAYWCEVTGNVRESAHRTNPYSDVPAVPCTPQGASKWPNEPSKSKPLASPLPKAARS